MLSRENLLTILRTCTVFMDTDTGQRVKVVCRYQQFQAARRVVERLCQGRQSEERGGVVWHTQGSGKSLTMVFVVRMLRASADLNDFKIVLVNDRTDPDKVDTGIAFLIVCDMLLTGFDALIEQVMYIDKKIQEHSLLQAIARVNRVATGKKRGYVVDYIGLANHLTSALSLYAAADEAQELHEGLKSIFSELPILEERYNRLIHYFEGLGVRRTQEFWNEINKVMPDYQERKAWLRENGASLDM